MWLSMCFIDQYFDPGVCYIRFVLPILQIPPVFSIDNNTESQIKNMQLQANETCAEMYVAKLLKQGDSAANFGVYSITWKR